MKFTSEIERLKHPLAKMIPTSAWNNFFSQDNSLSEFELKLMEEKSEVLETSPTEWPNFSKNKERFWICILSTHPHLDPDELIGIGKQLSINITFLFKLAAEMGNLGVLNRLIKLAPDQAAIQAMLGAGNYDAFCKAAGNGHKDVLERLIELAPDQATIQAMLGAENYKAFMRAAKSGHKDVLERLIELAPDQATIQAMLGASNYSAFRRAAESGHKDVLERLIKLAPDQATIQAMVEAFDYLAFGKAAQGGHKDVLERLIKLAPDQATIQSMLEAYEYLAFSSAARYGHKDVLERLIELAPDQANLQAMLGAENYKAFSSAARNGHKDVLERLIELVPDQANLQAMLKANKYLAFSSAARNGHKDVLERLIELAPDQANLQAMLKAGDYCAFRWAAHNSHNAIVNRLLLFPSVFSYAEMHSQEYSQLVYPYTTDTLIKLRTNREEFETSHPNTVFDVENGEQIQLYFYILRNLIRRNDPALLDDIRFLLDIPAVKALAHATDDALLTGSGENALLRLALSQGNQSAIELLITIPAVRTLAEANNYYRDEQRSGIDLAELAHDRESSMTALTSGEQKRLEAAIQKYQPLIANTGIDNIMTELQEELEVLYHKNAAHIEVKGKSIALPAEWNALTEMKLNDSEQEQAMQGYYQNKYHTALRYLSKPNSWMSPNASYVYINDAHTERWSTFEEYQPLIALFYLAASDNDKEILSEEFPTTASRLEHFINEMALIGRAHNWDKTRIKTNAEGKPVLDKSGEAVSEEYDDLKGDKPSCFSGVKRRLFQSVPGHPLLKVLTSKIIDQELNEFLQSHFKEISKNDNKKEMKSAWDNYVVDTEDKEAIETFMTHAKKYDVPSEKQQQFLLDMRQKYGEQLDPDLVTQIKETFNLTERKVTYISHFEKFYGRVNLDRLFEERLTMNPTSGLEEKYGGFFEAKTKGQIKESQQVESNTTPIQGRSPK